MNPIIIICIISTMPGMILLLYQYYTEIRKMQKIINAGNLYGQHQIYAPIYYIIMFYMVLYLFIHYEYYITTIYICTLMYVYIYICVA